MRYLPVLPLVLLLMVSCKNEAGTTRDGAGTPAAQTEETPSAQTEETSPPAPAPAEGQYQFPDIEGKQWVLSKYTFAGQRERIVGENPIYLTIQGGQLTGNGGCNSLNGQASLREDGGVSISGISKTKKLCAGLMTQEERIIQLLEGSKTYTVNLVFLEFTGPEGQLTFRNDRK